MEGIKYLPHLPPMWFVWSMLGSIALACWGVLIYFWLDNKLAKKETDDGCKEKDAAGSAREPSAIHSAFEEVIAKAERPKGETLP